jgi:hypothetical protein
MQYCLISSFVSYRLKHVPTSKQSLLHGLQKEVRRVLISMMLGFSIEDLISKRFSNDIFNPE